MSLDPDTLLIIAVAMVLGGFVKGATGQALPQVAIPVMASLLGVEHAVVVMAIPNIVANCVLLWTYRSYYNRTRDLPLMLGVGIFGAVAGAVLLRSLDDTVLSLTLASMIALYALLFFANPDLQLPPSVTRFSSPPVGLMAGLLQGSTGVSGPLTSTYVHAFRLEKEAYVLSISTTFMTFSTVQALTLAALGLYRDSRLLESLFALVPIIVTTPVGTRIARGMSRRAFDYLVLGVLLLSGTKLVYDALTG